MFGAIDNLTLLLVVAFGVGALINWRRTRRPSSANPKDLFS